METIIEMRNITKVFPGITANDDISLELRRGEIHALLGENGAGKSTLMSVLFGLYKPEHGEILKNGAPVRIHGPNDATRFGIGMAHQHFMLVSPFTVLENIILGVETVKGGLLKTDEARARVVELSERYKLDVDPDARIEDITVGMQQRVEILKMLYRDNEILIFDEPTAVLTPQEIDELMGVMKNLAAEGKSILFITHKLEEIKRVADRCTVLRKGKAIGTVMVADTTAEEMSEMMVGRKVSMKVDKTPAEPGGAVLDVRGLTLCNKTTGKNTLHDVTFSVAAGEIVSIAGVDGNGQSELVFALTGLVKTDKGTITLNGEDVTHSTVRERSERAMAHIPEDRHKYGLVLDYLLAYNLILQTYYKAKFSKNGFLRFTEIDAYAEGLIDKYDIRCGQGAKTVTRSMSGGNQQKAIVARELDREPKLLIAVQPTRGLDVGAIETIHKQLIAARDSGAAVLMVSFELDEVIHVSDRILVMFEGEIVADVKPENVTYQELGLYMAGSGKAVGE